MRILHTLGACLLIASATASSVGVSACCKDFGEGMKEGFEKSLAVSADIKTELGVDANVNMQINDDGTTIQVELQQTPEGDAAEIKTKVETIVRRHFPDAHAVDVKM